SGRSSPEDSNIRGWIVSISGTIQPQFREWNRSAPETAGSEHFARYGAGVQGQNPQRARQVYARGMNGGQDHNHDDDWQPATSKPGELYTPEGQIRMTGAFARGLTRGDSRNRAYRRSMVRSALMVIAMGVALIVVAALVSAVF
ncbi:MAG: hypothetical protein Q7V57_04200, partial [Actinomycetota bacterium]|nr:hypothetical protein [Actinomycetota bacterium]